MGTCLLLIAVSQGSKQNEEKRKSKGKKGTKIAILDSTVKYMIEREKEDDSIEKKSGGYETGKMWKKIEVFYKTTWRKVKTTFKGGFRKKSSKDHKTKKKII
jgi:hypothetical protein